MLNKYKTEDVVIVGAVILLMVIGGSVGINLARIERGNESIKEEIKGAYVVSQQYTNELASITQRLDALEDNARAAAKTQKLLENYIQYYQPKSIDPGILPLPPIFTLTPQIVATMTFCGENPVVK